MSDRVSKRPKRVIKRLRHEELQQHIEKLLNEIDEDEEEVINELSDDSSDVYVPPPTGLCPEESDAENEIVLEEDDIQDGVQEEDVFFEGESDDSSVEDSLIAQRPGALVAKDNTAWLTDLPNRSVRTGAHNVFRGTVVGPSRETKGLIESDLFDLIFTPSMLEQVLMDTNKKATITFQMWNEQNPTAKKRVWKNLTVMEFRAFIGLLLMMGVNKSNDEHVNVLWSAEAVCFYRAAMSKSRFQETLRFIRFDSERTRAARLVNDKAAPISALWTQMNQNLRKYYHPSGEITVDEQLFAYRGRTRFTQYIPSKPAKYGIKVWFACDAKSFYPLNSEIYTGKTPDKNRASNVGEAVVKSLVHYWENTGRTIISDNFFTSLNLAKYLMSKNLAILGTVRQNKTFLPKEMKADRKREIESSVFGFLDAKFALVSYVPKKGKAVIILSSTPLTNAVVPEKKNKPQYILDYNANKGGFDAMDKMLSAFSTKRKTLRWPLAMFFNMLDISALAAFIIYSENNPHIVKTDKRRKFLRSLAKQLFMPAIEERAKNPHVLSCTSTRLAIEMALGSPISTSVTAFGSSDLPDISNDKMPKNPVRCQHCEIGKRKTTRKMCSWCKKPVCDAHAKTYTLGECCAKKID